MPSPVSLTIGGRSVTMTRSETQVAVKPAPGMEATFESVVRSGAPRAPADLSVRVGDYQIVEVPASEEGVMAERGRLAESPSVGDAAPVYFTAKDSVPFVPEGTIFLSFKPDVSADRKQEILGQSSLELVREERGGFLTVRPTTNLDPVEVAATLQTSPEVYIAEPDLMTKKELAEFSMPSDELLKRLWPFENLGEHNGTTHNYKKGADARIVAAWKAIDGLGSEDAIIGIIDDGFDLTHPDLAGKAVDPWDFLRNSADVSPVPNLHLHKAGNWHGTACAGLAAASATGGKMIGVAPLARIIPLRTGDLSDNDLMAWFDYMTDHGAWVVSCSWGPAKDHFPLSTRVAQAIARCARDGRGGKGAVVVFAAGNHNRSINDGVFLNGLAAHPDVVAVAASTSIDSRADYSDFGAEIWVCAPSGGGGFWNVITTDALGTYRDSGGATLPMGYDASDYARAFFGTSAGCPIVAGVCALVLSANPELSGDDVRGILRDTARRIGPEEEYVDDRSPHFGFGCVNAEKAVKEAIRRVPVA